jgi:hypothetical protein
MEYVFDDDEFYIVLLSWAVLLRRQTRGLIARVLGRRWYIGASSFATKLCTKSKEEKGYPKERNLHISLALQY